MKLWQMTCTAEKLYLELQHMLLSKVEKSPTKQIIIFCVSSINTSAFLLMLENSCTVLCNLWEENVEYSNYIGSDSTSSKLTKIMFSKPNKLMTFLKQTSNQDSFNSNRAMMLSPGESQHFPPQIDLQGKNVKSHCAMQKLPIMIEDTTEKPVGTDVVFCDFSAAVRTTYTWQFYLR